MPLPATSRAILERYKKFRERPPTVLRLFWVSALDYVVLLIVLCPAAVLSLALGLPDRFMILGALVTGFVLRDFQLFR